MFHASIGPFRVPAQEGEALYGTLYGAAMVQRWWLMEADPGTADTLVGGALPWWPESPMAALLQAILPLDPGFSLGLLIAGAVWLAGYGPYRLGRAVVGAGWGPLVAGLAVQSSPMVLRGIPGTDLAALGVGALALGLAEPRLAWLGGLWSWPAALFLAGAGLFRRNLWLLLAGLPVLAALFPETAVPGALSSSSPPLPSAPGYFGKSGALFPMPPPETVELRQRARETGLWLSAGEPAGKLPPLTPGSMGTDGTMPGGEGNILLPGGTPTDPVNENGGAQPNLRPGLPGGQPMPEAPLPGGLGSDPGAIPEGPQRHWIGAVLVPLQRLHGGPVLLVGLLLGLLDPRARRWSVAGLTLWFGITAVYGWQSFPEEAEVAPHTVSALRLLLDGDQIAALPGRPDGLAFGALIGVCGALGLASFFRGGRLWFSPLILLGVLLENPRLAAPVTPLLPDPLLQVLAALPGGGMIVFPAPQAPYFQGTRSGARVLWEAALAGKRLPAAPEPVVAGVVAALSREVELPVDVQASRWFWAAPAEAPFEQALAQDYAYMIVDMGGVPQPLRPRLDGWLAAEVGMPLAREGGRLLYDLQRGPAGIASPLDALPGQEGRGEKQPLLPPLGDKGQPPMLPPMDGTGQRPPQPP